jgi:hypothetical protein
VSQKFLVVNTSPTKTRERSQKEIISLEHEKIMDSNRRVKFENLKYDLTELFESQPAFDEPLPLYNMMYDFIPQKVSIVGAKQKVDAEGGRPKVPKMELARMNNLAMANICQNKKDPNVSPWNHYLKMVANRKVAREVI